MKRSVMSAMFAAAMSAVVMAQSGGPMEKSPSMSKMEKMDMMAVRATYTGCLEAGSAAGAFSLTHADRMSSDSMKKDAMAKDAAGMDVPTFTVKSLRVLAASCQ